MYTRANIRIRLLALAIKGLFHFAALQTIETAWFLRNGEEGDSVNPFHNKELTKYIL
jgi:hypothetical protein